MAINLILFGATGLGLLAVGLSAGPAPQAIEQPAVITTPAPVLETAATAIKFELDEASVPAEPAKGTYGPDGVFIPAGMTLEDVYAEHDAEVARLMAAMPDDPLIGGMSYVDAETGEEIPIDLIAF